VIKQLTKCAEILELLHLAVSNQGSPGFHSICRAAIVAFGRTRSASYDSDLQAALKELLRCRPPAFVFQSLAYTDESRLCLARLLLEELADSQNLRHAGTRTTVILSLHHLNCGAISICHASWCFRFILLLDLLPPDILSDEVKTLRDLHLQNLRRCCRAAMLPLQGEWQRAGMCIHLCLCSMIVTDILDVLELLRCVTSIVQVTETSPLSWVMKEATIFALRTGAADIRLSVDGENLALRAALRSLLYSVEDTVAQDTDFADRLREAGAVDQLRAADLLPFDSWPQVDAYPEWGPHATH
jgi:hypothetical protein